MKLSEQIMIAYKVGGKGWNSDDVREWMWKAAQLEAELAKEKETVTFLDASLDIKQRLVVAENRVSQLEAENKRYRDALYSIAGTNTKPSHLKIAWKEMMLVTKQRAKEALGGE